MFPSLVRRQRSSC